MLLQVAKLLLIDPREHDTASAELNHGYFWLLHQAAL